MERKELELHQDKLENEFHAERFAKWMALSKAEWRAKQDADAKVVAEWIETTKAEWRAKQAADSEAVAEGHLKVNTRPQQRE